jgi:serine/threonine protein kinase
MSEKESWRFAEGDEIVAGRVAVRKLGGGSRYEAYLAWDDKLYTLVVAKVLRPNRVDDERARRGIAKEHEMLARLNHPVIPRSFGLDLDGPHPHLVLEHIDGPRLSTLLRKYGPLPVEQSVTLALQLCSAVHYLAAEGVVHLDIKPGNIIMSAPPRLIDMSVAKTMEDAAALKRHVGTDDYMAPEQCVPAERGGVTVAADMWGLGATLYKAVTGELPFSPADDSKKEPAERWPALVEDPDPFPPDIPEAIAAPLTRCLDKDPARRPTAAELHDELEPLLAQLPKPRIGRLKPKIF